LATLKVFLKHYRHVNKFLKVPLVESFKSSAPKVSFVQRFPVHLSQAGNCDTEVLVLN